MSHKENHYQCTKSHIQTKWNNLFLNPRGHPLIQSIGQTSPWQNLSCALYCFSFRYQTSWQSTESSVPKQLKATHARQGNSSECLEVLSNTWTISRRLEYTLICELSKIFAKPEDNPLKQLIIQLISDTNFLSWTVLTPLHLMMPCA
jgi:hypothetical protein